jgi:adenylate kinase
MESIVFIAGVHGAGKSHFTSFLSDRLSLPEFSASELIRLEKNKPVDKSKVVIEPDENQDFLVTAISKLDIDSESILLDGHFSLLRDDGFFDVPLETFLSLPIGLVVLKTESEKVIHDRLSSRDGKSLDMGTISRLQDREISRAKYVTRKLGVPLIELKGNDYGCVTVAVQEHLS